MKKQYISILILVLLVVLYFIVQHREKSMIAPKSVENFLGVDTSQVDMITIGRLGGATTLTKAAGNCLSATSATSSKRAAASTARTTRTCNAGSPTTISLWSIARVPAMWQRCGSMPQMQS